MPAGRQRLSCCLTMDRAQILRAFHDKGFPNCFGAIDCTHIYIDKPADAPSANYYNRNHKFSVQAQVIVDLDLRILDVHIGHPGSVHDVRILHNSQLWRRAQTCELFDATPENLPHGVVTRGYLLGNNGYPFVCPWIVQPNGGIDQGPDEERFDNRQKVARGCVERAFGRLKCMWRLFLRTHKTNLETLPQQFVAVCTLHNILLDAGIDFDENLLWEVGPDGVRRRVDLGIVGGGGGERPQSSNVKGKLLRNALRDRLALICGRSEGVAGKRFAEMDGGGCGHGLRAEEMEAVAMAVSTVVLKTMNEMSSSSRDVAKQLRERRALLQSVVEAADCIVAALAAFVEKKVTHYRTPLPAEQVIAFALYKWASGETYESGTSAFGIGRAAGLQAVRDVTSALLRAYPDAIKWPVVVDLDLRILDVHVGYPGSVHDVHVLHNSQLWRRAQTGELFDAAPENLPHGVVTRGYLLGDNGYPVACPWIVQPYGGIDQGPDEERFDNGQKVARGCVERAFGRLKCMWRLFLRTHKTNLETLPQQFVAACTLRRVDLGIVGAGGGGRPQSSNVEEELLRNALRDRLALM
ncbi:hypothetical protein CBR_g19861 [Chara braunii]|uniref:DDE Tnp4 domain-containing protein n=1 Tax=Chara braunii TaxID=69332 RepID=A0A388KYV1_CHABU|nr:hypothetical protein CBR_g19861 [Chara braunii]|eukprot:GBG75225.1 hypothetical protein CBR_g19861 [Chara braunii]